MTEMVGSYRLAFAPTFRKLGVGERVGTSYRQSERDTLEAEGPGGENLASRHPCGGFNPDRHYFSRCISIFGGHLDWDRARSN
jgi:hypothetical protein